MKVLNVVKNIMPHTTRVKRVVRWGGIFLAATLGLATTFTLTQHKPAFAVCNGVGQQGGTIQTTTSSTYTPGMCIGQPIGGPTSASPFVEFVVTFSFAVPDATVTFKNGNGNTNNSPAQFHKVNDKTYALSPDTFQGVGYQTSSTGSATACNNDKNNQINIHIQANGQTEDIPTFNVCSGINHNQYTFVEASQSITGGGGQGPTTGGIVGTVTLRRVDGSTPPKPLYADNDPRAFGTVQKPDVISITYTRQGDSPVNGDNNSSWYNLINIEDGNNKRHGEFTMPNLKPGTYNIQIQYNDHSDLTPTTVYTFTANNVVVTAGKQTNVNFSVSAAPNNGFPVTGNQDDAVCSTGSGLAGAAGYVLCPAMQLVADTVQFIQDNFIIPYLTVNPLTTQADSNGNPPVVYTLWKSFRDLANIMLVIAFFVVIFSQATSIGLSNDGIKKMLPRLAVVAIGANLSFFIIAFIIDAFNIFGAGVAALVMSVVNVANPTGGGLHRISTFQELFQLGTSGVLLRLIGVPVFRYLFGLIMFVFLFILITVGVLILRQMLLLMLVVLAAPAIVLYLLPNTERWFTRWREFLLQLLVMYPIIVLIFASGKIIGTVLANSTIVIGG